MRRSTARSPDIRIASRLAAVLLVCSTALLTPRAVKAEPRLTAAVERAASLAGVPRHVRVQAIDPDLTASPDAVRLLDAFIVREADGSLRPVIYLNAHARLVRRAVSSTGLEVHLLAAVLVHELVHLRGAGEAEARRAERDYLARMVRARELSAADAARFLGLLGAASR